MFQAHFLVKISQGGLGAFWVQTSPAHKEAHGDASKNAQYPRGIGIANAAAIFIGAGIQSLVQSAFNAPIVALIFLPLGGAQAAGFAAAQQVLDVGFFSQAFSQDDRALCGGWKAGLLGADGDGAKGPGFNAPAILFPGSMRPVGWQGVWRGKKAARHQAASWPGSFAVASDWL